MSLAARTGFTIASMDPGDWFGGGGGDRFMHNDDGRGLPPVLNSHFSGCGGGPNNGGWEGVDMTVVGKEAAMEVITEVEGVGRVATVGQDGEHNEYNMINVAILADATYDICKLTFIIMHSSNILTIT